MDLRPGSFSLLRCYVQHAEESYFGISLSESHQSKKQKKQDWNEWMRTCSKHWRKKIKGSLYQEAEVHSNQKLQCCGDLVNTVCLGDEPTDAYVKSANM